jgi:hypothetical protein
MKQQQPALLNGYWLPTVHTVPNILWELWRRDCRHGRIPGEYDRFVGNFAPLLLLLLPYHALKYTDWILLPMSRHPESDLQNAI